MGSQAFAAGLSWVVISPSWVTRPIPVDRQSLGPAA